VTIVMTCYAHVTAAVYTFCVALRCVVCVVLAVKAVLTLLFLVGN